MTDDSRLPNGQRRNHGIRVEGKKKLTVRFSRKDEQLLLIESKLIRCRQARYYSDRAFAVKQ